MRCRRSVRFEGVAGVVEVDGVGLAGVECLREVDEDGSGIALVLQLCVAEEILSIFRAWLKSS